MVSQGDFVSPKAGTSAGDSQKHVSIFSQWLVSPCFEASLDGV